MAGRYVLIEFDDKASAEKLIQQINAGTRKGKRFRAVGLFAKPGPDFCGCGSEWTTTRSKPARVKRGPKFGWQVCLDCKKPIPVMSHLKNLIAPQEIIDPVTHQAKYQGRVYQAMFHCLGLDMTNRAVDKVNEKQ